MEKVLCITEHKPTHPKFEFPLSIKKKNKDSNFEFSRGQAVHLDLPFPVQ